MSSLRNAVKRITHKERSQPTRRSHLGALEKHQDYVKRAKDYHKKQNALNAAKQKASLRNPDEFYFGMHKAQIDEDSKKHRKTEQAVREEFEQTVGDAAAIRILKDQDIRYIRSQRQRDAKKAEKLKESLHNIDSNMQQPKHTIFVSSKTELEEFDVAKHFDTVPELVQRTHNRLKVDQIVMAPSSKRDRLELKRATRTYAKARTTAYREMLEREKRVRKLTNVEAQMVLERQLAAPGKKRKIKAAVGGKPAVYKWSRKRLR